MHRLDERATFPRMHASLTLDQVLDMPWRAPPKACLTALRSQEQGLSSTEANTRLQRCGANGLPYRSPPGAIARLAGQLRSPLIYLLLAAALLSLIARDYTDAGFVFVVLMVNALFGVAQEGRAGAAARALETMAQHRARVRRDGWIVTIDAASVVPGDILFLEGGARVPADARLITARGLRIDESILTGEAEPVDKIAEADLAADTLVPDRSTMVHAGTMILAGTAIGLVTATGARTELGHIAGLLKARPPTLPPLMASLRTLARQVAIAILVLVAAVGVMLAIQGEPLRGVLLFAAALAVSAVPEGLPLAVTVTLARATQRMAARGVIVRTLPAVEGLGSCTLIASDKTGTLTQNRLSVEAFVTTGGTICNVESWALDGVDDAVRDLVSAAAQCSEVTIDAKGQLLGDSVDVALSRFGITVGWVEEERLATHPYDPADAFASAAMRDGLRVRVVAKGAIERIVAMCDRPASTLLAAAEELAARGYRVIAVAESHVDTIEADTLASPRSMTLLGCFALFDPLRPEAREAVRQCLAAGIGVRIITGDHPETARAIAAKLGLELAADEILTGPEITALARTPDLMMRRIHAAKVYARTSPGQKLVIVECLQRAGECVAVTGDGVNDAPALQAASIGVAMAKSGTDVARGAADLLLTDDNFASIVAGIAEGRICYTNIRNIVIFLLATGLAEIATVVGAVLLGLPVPLTAVQLLWANIVTEGFQTATLAMGIGDGDELGKPPRPVSARLVDRKVVWRMVVPAIAMAVFALWCFEGLLASGQSVEAARNAVLLCVVLFQNAFLLSMRSASRNRKAARTANIWLLGGIAAALILQLAAMTVPPLQAVLGTVFPNLTTLGIALGGAALTWALAELAKPPRSERTGPGPRHPSQLEERRS